MKQRNKCVQMIRLKVYEKRHYTPDLCPLNDRTCLSVVKSQIVTDLSSLPETKNLLSELRSRQLT